MVYADLWKFWGRPNSCHFDLRSTLELNWERLPDIKCVQCSSNDDDAAVTKLYGSQRGLSNGSRINNAPANDAPTNDGIANDVANDATSNDVAYNDATSNDVASNYAASNDATLNDVTSNDVAWNDARYDASAAHDASNGRYALSSGHANATALDDDASTVITRISLATLNL